ncbi:hypothetical protein C7T94_07770 [Pedobacter yulinensis]|uniref:Lipocalin-like domain-containing protein n=2 Tax=Pedobacter yulinensis TaxID=2126353 RepID=A0A2T3HJE8_9SPHI|nr:hypothetical protein C7T94_07770 [Pedobacter yulinensis]
MTSCKKEPTQSDFEGLWTVTEVELYNPPSTTAYPSAEGEYGTLNISFQSDRQATLRLQMYDKSQRLRIDESYPATYTTDQDGDPVFKADDGTLIAAIFDLEIDFYGIRGARIAAKK